MTTRHDLASAAPTAQPRRRRLGLALLLMLLAAPAVAAADESKGPVYIWRDASGAVRFSAPPPR